MTTTNTLVRGPIETVADVCIYYPVVVSQDATLREVASKMREHHIGDVIVTQAINGRVKPIGMITDRDIVIQVIAKDADTRDICATDIMSPDLHTMATTMSIDEAITLMHKKGVRRFPVVDGSGCLVGVVTIDDLLGVVAKQLAQLFDTFGQARAQEIKLRR